MDSKILDITKVQEQVGLIAQGLHDNDMEVVKNHMHVVSDYLKGTPHLGDVMLPEDLGVLVMAERQFAEEDLLKAKKPKRQTKAQIAASLADLDDDF